MTHSPQSSTQSDITRRPAAAKWSKTKKIMVPGGIVLVGIAIFAGMSSMAPKPIKKAVETKAPLVDVVTVQRGDVVFEIESQGSISPRTETTLVSEVSGVVKSVSDKFVVGGFFRQGELMLTIDPINYEVALLQAQARLDAANARLVEENARGQQAEQEWLLTGRTLSNAPILALRTPQLQQAKADVKAAQADVRSAEIKLKRTRILAPYDAMLKAKLVDIGQYVTTGAQLASTFAIDYAEVRLPIKEQDFKYIQIPSLGLTQHNDGAIAYPQRTSGSQKASNKPMAATAQIGAAVEISLEQGGEMKTWFTHIVRSEGVIDRNSRVNYVVAQINDPYGVLAGQAQAEPIRMGAFVKAKIFGKTVTDVVTVPRKALRGADALYLLDDKQKLKLTKVDIIRSDSQNIYLRQGVNDGEQVVLTKLDTPIAGMALRLPGQTSDTESAAEIADKTNLDTGTNSTSVTESLDANEKAPAIKKDLVIAKEPESTAQTDLSGDQGRGL